MMYFVVFAFDALFCLHISSSLFADCLPCNVSFAGHVSTERSRLHTFPTHSARSAGSEEIRGPSGEHSDQRHHVRLRAEQEAGDDD